MVFIKKNNVLKLLWKVTVFSLLATLFFLLTPNLGYFGYLILDICAVGWFLLEYFFTEVRNIIKKALILGLFLMSFDWLFENFGALINLWETHGSLFSIGAVPIEIMFLALIGGTAWAMHLPKKFNRVFAFFECLIFAFYGALGEYLLIKNNLMTYITRNTSFIWRSLHAFTAYFITWIILFTLWYKVINKV